MVVSVWYKLPSYSHIVAMETITMLTVIKGMAMARHMVIQILNQATKEAMWHSMCQEPNRFTSITTTGTINSMDMIQSLGRIPTIPISIKPSSML